MLAYSQVPGQAPHAHKTDPAVIEYLALRGISITLAAELGIKVLLASELKSSVLGYPISDTRWAIVFPHRHHHAELLDWWSARLVEPTPELKPTLERVGQLVVHSFSEYQDSTERRFSGKMFCPPKVLSAAYLPHTQSGSLPDWRRIRPHTRVFIHESVIKSINCAVLGHYAIGLNGVRGWSSKNHDVSLLPEIRDIEWASMQLNPVILFDTNIETNTDVQLAARRLAVRMHELTGRVVKLLRIPIDPKAEGGDEGFDDYVQRVGSVEARALLDTPDDQLESLDIAPLELGKLQLNSEVAVVLSMKLIANIKTGTMMSRGEFTDVVYADRIAEGPPNDAGVTRPVSIPSSWMKWPSRNTVESLVYEPGKERVFVDDVGQRMLNMWHGWGCHPRKGNVDPWLSLLSGCIRDEEMVEWVQNWLAYPLQVPGGKLDMLLLLVGKQGSGKDMVLKPIHDIYGFENSVKIGNHDLSSQFNTTYGTRQFVHADELKRHLATSDEVNQTLKGMVTNPHTIVNGKHAVQYKIRNVMNVAITSNYFDCVKLDNDDRRAAVVNWVNDPKRSWGIDYWNEYAAWTNLESSPPALYEYLLSRDLTGFNPKGHAPNTDAKRAVIESGRDPVEDYVQTLREAPELRLGGLALAQGRMLFTSKELAMHLYGENATPAAVMSLGRAMLAAGFEQANGRRPVRSRTGLARWWVVPRPELPDLCTLNWQSASVCGHHLGLHGL